MTDSLQYKIIADCDVTELNANVNYYLQQGWCLQGDHCSSRNSNGTNMFSQALIKFGP